MIKDAEANAESDKKRREEADLRNEADQLIFTTNKTLEELKDKVSEEEVKKAEAARDELQAAIDANDLEEIKSKRDALTEVVQNLSVKLYEQAAQATQDAQANSDQTESSSDDNVVDAEFEEVDDEE